MIKEKLSSKYLQYRRVWRLLKKPTKQEFLTISKISGIGLLIIGIIGFAIALIMNLFW
ncbi:MAG: protein translocase SEC61 complex subunit gamma [Candidatus Nanoarchaeia archaeon]|jgi:protein transport protein SEC61 subunit gamma-like protein|nr:protein translocase SEC61 complex subunit gamma [Candidatus Nanoarchaeia archaeon]MDD3993703.1 protein translocase SEC61 complex subunit gamma [Candidatus Nanoarchaeia archaeon]MDD4563736.1 protein translocase SEC61 complex subunit gamma [Candidatus Nanoarchaeia archaeon]